MAKLGVRDEQVAPEVAFVSVCLGDLLMGCSSPALLPALLCFGQQGAALCISRLCQDSASQQGAVDPQLQDPERACLLNS